MTSRVSFSAGGVALEGMLNLKGMDRAAVVAHPHPLYGGNMFNPVVEAIAESYERKGFSTLRFNFRGVGGSEGSYDDGRGEVADVLAAVSFLTERGIERIDLAGYSFGTWVISKVPMDPSWTGQIVMISPPVAFMDMPSSLRLPNLYLVVTGEMDDIAPPDRVRKRLTDWNGIARMEIITGADHFYGRGFGKLREILDNYL
ncbi:MAG: alpha/beta hydrolase [Pseudomonadota bacterium]